MQEVKERLKLNNLPIDNVIIRSKLKYLIGAKVVETMKWNRGPVRTRPRTRLVPLFSGEQPGLDHPVRFQTLTAAGQLRTVANTSGMIENMSRAKLERSVYFQWVSSWCRHQLVISGNQGVLSISIGSEW